MKRIKSFSNYKKINEEYSFVTLEDAAREVNVTMDAVYKLEDVEDSEYFINLYKEPYKTEIKDFLRENMNKEIKLKDIPKFLHDIEWFYGVNMDKDRGPRDMLKTIDFGVFKRGEKYVSGDLFKLKFIKD